MSKTESRDYWVTTEQLANMTKQKFGYEYFEVRHTPYEEGSIKVTISWQVPEKVVTISESEFQKLLENINLHNFDHRPDGLALYIKEKLFEDKV